MSGKYVAIWDSELNDYKWFSIADAQYNFIKRVEDPPSDEWGGTPKRIMPNGCVEIHYESTGQFIKRKDGERTEIFKAIT